MHGDIIKEVGGCGYIGQSEWVQQDEKFGGYIEGWGSVGDEAEQDVLGRHQGTRSAQRTE